MKNTLLELGNTIEIDPERLRSWRKSMLMSQARLANCLQVDQATVCLWEHGQEPSGPAKILLAMLMGVTNGKV